MCAFCTERGSKAKHTQNIAEASTSTASPLFLLKHKRSAVIRPYQVNQVDYK